MSETPAGEPAFAGWVPSRICRDIRLAEIAGRQHFISITVTAEAVGSEPPPQFPVRADLGRRIADLIRSDAAQG